jgi:hypothetical protein
MKRELSVLAIAGVLTASQRSLAVEGPGDVESDHIDAADDGGPRSVGLLLHPIGMAAGWLGAEIDAACGEHLVLGLEADGRFAWVHGVRAALDALLFPQRFSFHGIYVHPTFEWDRMGADGATATILGGAITVGYAWTWPSGPTFRLGGGVGYTRGAVDGSAPLTALEGWRPQVDADLGWVF